MKQTKEEMAKDLMIFGLIIIPILIVGYIDGQDAKMCHEQKSISVHDCLKMHALD
jgi:hypothetical protein